MEKEKNTSNFDEQMDEITRERKERARKWQIYRAAKNWIKPSSPFRMMGEKENYYTKSMFAKCLDISKEEAEKVIAKLIEEKKLEKTEEGIYKAVRICTMCGHYFDDWDLEANNYIYHYFGFGSKKDDKIFEADLCCDCYDKIIDKIIPLFPLYPLKESCMGLPEDDPY